MSSCWRWRRRCPAFERILLADGHAGRSDACPAQVYAVAHGAGTLHRRVVAVRLASEREAEQPRARVLVPVHRTLCLSNAKNMAKTAITHLLLTLSGDTD